MKRKIELVNSNSIESKTPSKADLINQENIFKMISMLLKLLTKKNLETIRCLQEKIENMEIERQTFPKETQTEQGIELKYDECNFETTNQLAHGKDSWMVTRPEC